MQTTEKQESQFDQELSSLRIDRGARREPEPKRWAKWWILIGIALFAAFGAWRFGVGVSSAIEVETVRVQVASAGEGGNAVVLQAAGYVVAHHKIEVASKVVGRVAWIGVEKGDKVGQGQMLVRLEDAEFAARVLQAEGRLASLKARLDELEAGSRKEEVMLAKANLDEAKAALENARIDLERVRTLVAQGVAAQQDLDNAQARYDGQAARVQSLDRAYELVRIGPRAEAIDAVRGQVREAEGERSYARTLLDATVIRAPVAGTILERNVEVGEFVTTGFVGDRGAKGYVVSLADLNDIQVELDISQDDFAKLSMGQDGVVTTDAFRDREYKGRIVEISPEADRQKATVQVKVQILEPDDYLRPEMNANVAFIAPEKAEAGSVAAKPAITIPASALRDGNTVFLKAGDKAVRRPVTVGRTISRGVEITDGLSGGEDLIVNPPPELADGSAVRLRSS